MLCAYGDQVEISLSSCGHTCTELEFVGNGRKGRTEKFVKVGQILLLYDDRPRKFHISGK